MSTQVIAEHLAARNRATVRRRSGLQQWLAGWAAFGITLSGATQLRIAGQPIGPSELILVGWLLFVLFLRLRGMPVASSRVPLALGVYWLVVLTILGFGALVATQTGQLDANAAMHDSIAYVYLALLTSAISLRILDEGEYRFHWYFAQTTFFFHVLAATLLYALAMKIDQIGPVGFWFGPRLRGWSENPNQLGLAMAAMPFLGWWLLRRTSSRFGKIVWASGIALCMVVGIASQSDGLRAAWVASFGAVGSLLVFRVTVRGRFRWLQIVLFIVPALMAAFVALLHADDVIDFAYDVADRVYAEGDQGEKRFELWNSGIQAIAASPVVGFGPGHFSGYFGPFEHMEAHNSFIDWGASTGLAGLLIYLGLLAWVLGRALQSGETELVGMLVAVVMTSVFSYLLRQPDFWTAVVLVLVLSESVIAIRERQAGRFLPEAHRHGPRLTLRPAPPLQQSGWR
jgi:O-antigen ligase